MINRIGPLNSEAEKNASRLAERIRARCHPSELEAAAAATTAIASVGICGVGIMGSGIAAASVKQGMPVVLFDASAESLARGRQLIENELQWAHAVEFDPASPIRSPAGGRDTALRTADSVREFSHCDLVVESVVENKQLKQRVLRQLEANLKPQAILATNTSTLSISELSGVLDHADRFCGIHFFNPIDQRPLVEIVPARDTSPATIAAATAYVLKIGKLPIVVRDSPGFLVNRLLVPYMNEALEMVCEGVDIVKIDQAAEDFGMPIGPLALFDLIGTDTSMLGGRTVWEAYPDRITLTPILPALVKRGRLGRKTRRGFYMYDDDQGHGQRVDPELQHIIEPYVRSSALQEPYDMMLRLLLPMFLEATRAWEEGIVRSAADIDAAVLFGLAFPTSRGGLLYWADQIGMRQILELLKPFASLGKRMQPSEALRSLAAGRAPSCYHCLQV